MTIESLFSLIILDVINSDAFLVAPSNENIIAQRLTKLIENKELRDEMGEKAFAQSLNFSVHKMIDHYTDLYKKISDG